MSALSQALPLALAAAFYPPAILVVILLLTGDHPRRLVLSYLAGAALIVVAVGVLFLFVLTGTSANDQDDTSASGGVDIVLGVLLLAFAVWAWRRHRRPSKPEPDTPKQDGRLKRMSVRATTSVTWAFALGILMYLPSPFYLAAIKAIADSGDSDASQLLAVLICGAAVMLFVEIPALVLVLRPEGLKARLERFDAWLSRNAWALLAVLAAAVGVYLVVSGVAAM